VFVTNISGGGIRDPSTPFGFASLRSGRQCWNERDSPTARNYISLAPLRQDEIVMKLPILGLSVFTSCIVALCIVFAASGLSAQMGVWQPSAGHTQVPIWPGKGPDAVPVAGPEYSKTVGDQPPTAVVTGRVSRPTMTVYSPTRKNTGAAVVVFPGGGYFRDLARTQITHGIRGCATNGGTGAIPRCGVGNRSAQDWSAGVFGRRASGGSGKHALQTALVSGPWMRPTKKAAARTSAWLFIRDTCWRTRRKRPS